MTPTTITVTTSSDAVVHNNISLRDAIALANVDAATGVSDTIVFDSSLQGKTIVMAQGPFQLSGTGAIIIDAATNQITLNGGNIGNILKVNAGATATLIGFTFINGKVVSTNADVRAGAIENNGTLSIFASAIDGASATALGATNNAQGGAIFNTGNLTISQSTITNSQASAGNSVQGGAIYNSGTLHLVNTHVDNSTTTAKTSQGSGIFNSATLMVDSVSTISFNTAMGGTGPYIGGAIYNGAAGTATLDQVTIQNNTAVGGGGGIFSDIVGANAGTVSVSNSSILGNSGGGIHAQGKLTLALTDVKNNTLVENNGAGVFSTGTGSILGGTISGNTVTCSQANLIASAGVFSTGALTVTNAVITNNTGTSSGSAITSGVGLYCSAALTVAGSTISNNTGSTSGTGTFFGGGIFGATTLIISTSTITNNSATTSSTGAMAGAGVYSGGTLTITDSTITNNSDTATGAANITGAGVFCPGQTSLTNVSVTGNTATTTGAGNITGAGVFAQGQLTLTNVAVTGNTATTGGGNITGAGVYSQGQLSLTNVNVTGNTATTSGAGNITGAGVYGPGPLSIAGSNISANTATGATGTVLGVGVYTTTTSTILQTTIADNTTSMSTGAIIFGIGIYNTGTSTILQSTISGNKSLAGPGASGGGIYNTGTSTLSESTVYGNFAVLGGGLLNGDAAGVGAMALSECTFADNQATTAGGGIFNRGQMVLRSTIMANDTAPAGPDVGVDSTILVQILLGEHDLIQRGAGLESTEIADGINENIIGHDPLIYDVLANYGGPTKTIPLLAGSPAFANGGVTTISADIDASVTTIPVENTAVFMSTFISGRVVQLDDEQMLITGFNLAGLTLTVQRAFNGTAAAAHVKFTHVFPTLDQLGQNRVVNHTTDIGASTFVKDVTPPTVTITQRPNPITNSISATFGFDGSDDMTPTNQILFMISLDAGPFVTATSPTTFNGLAAGTHKFQVKAIDLQGNFSVSPLFQWIVDLQAPVVSLTQTPALITNGTTAIFAFAATDNVSPPGQVVFKTSLDGGAFVTTTSPQTVSGLAAGAHKFQVEALDQAGNIGTSALFQWTIDLIGPTVTITQTPPALTNLVTASFSFTGTDNLTSAANLVFKISLDAGPFTTSASPALLSNLSSGDHTFKVESIDQAGNVSTPASFTWTVDATPPTVQLTQTPAAATSSTSATFAFSGNDNRTPAAQLIFQVSLDGGGFIPATSPVNFTNLALGSHTFKVSATDEVGNTSPIVSFTWVIDQTAPTASFTQQPANPTNQQTATFAFTGADNVTPAGLLLFNVSIDGGSFVAATSPVSTGGLADGSHTFQVEAVDQAGNVGSPVSYTWVVDTVVPTVSITQQPAALTNLTSATFTFAGTDNLSSANQLTFQYSLDNGSFAAATNPLTLTGLGGGSHTFKVESVDQAGNASSPATFTWVVDTIAPTIALTATPPSTANAATSTFSFTGTDDVTPAAQVVFQYSLDGGAFIATTSPLALPAITTGAHAIQIEAVDQAGNRSTPASFSWNVDAELPTVKLTQTPSSATQSSLASFAFTGSDNLTPQNQLIFQTSLDGAAFATATSPVSLTDLTPGTHTFVVQDVDLAGNVSTPATFTWIIDVTPPTASITGQPPATSFATTATFAFSGTDTQNTPAQLQFKVSLDSAAFVSSASPLTFDKLVLGKHSFQVEAIDQAGNVSPIVSYTWTVATPPPASQLQFSAAGYGIVRTQNLINLVVVRTGSVALPVTVDYATSDGTAVGGVDFTKIGAGTLSFPVGALTGIIPITILNAGAAGANGKVFRINLSNSTNGATLTNLATATITINDPLPQDPVPGNLFAAANAFTRSQEALGNFVEQAYTAFLRRPSELNGLQFWTSQLAAGLTDQQLEAKFIGSKEYIQNHGGSGAGWVTGMYQDLLGRAPDPNGLAFWTGQLKAGISPEVIALGFAASSERESNLLAADYRIYLDRAIDDVGKNMWLQKFATGTQNEEIVASLVGSAEYFGNLAKGQQNRAQFVRRAIDDILHREASDQEVNFWSSFLK